MKGRDQGKAFEDAAKFFESRYIFRKKILYTLVVINKPKFKVIRNKISC